MESYVSYRRAVIFNDVKIREEYKEHIQWFAYYLFTGSLSPNLIASCPRYVEYLTKNPSDLVEIFHYFAQLQSDEFLSLNFKQITSQVGDRIQSKLTQTTHNEVYNPIISNFNSFWSEYMRIVTIFSTNSFPRQVREFKLEEMCGTDAVPFFAVWTNNIELDKYGTVLNAEYALKRANERLLIWDGKLPDDVEPFSEVEFEQLIY